MIFNSYHIIHILLVFVNLLLIIVLLFKGKHLVSNKLIACFLFAQILYSLNEFYLRNTNFNYVNVPYLAYIALPFFCVWGPSMYLYIKSEITPNFRFKAKHLIHFLPFILLTIYFLCTFHFQSIEEKKQLLISKAVFSNFYRKIFVMFVGFQVFIYNIISIINIEKFSKKNTLKTRSFLSKIRWNKFIIYGYFLACLFNNLSIYIFIYSANKNVSLYLHISSLLFLVYFSIILGRALIGSHFGDALKKSTSITEDEYANLNSKLESYMKEEKPFLQFGLTLSDFATQLNVKERLLSQFINSHYNSTFQDYINVFRIEEAKKIIEQNKDSGKTILEIVYESGFNSKSAFNYAFKKHTQTTPTSYKKSLK